MPKSKIGIGHNLLLEDLDDIYPQPQDATARPVRSYSDTGIKTRYFFIPEKWNIVGTKVLYQGLLTAHGILTLKISPVTIYCKDELYEWNLFNGYAVQPEFDVDISYNNFYLRNLVIDIKDAVKIEV